MMEEMTPTEMLRAICDEYGIPWSDVLYRDGHETEYDHVTTIGRGARSLTFVERDGTFDCLDGMSPYEAFAAGVCAWAEDRL